MIDDSDPDIARQPTWVLDQDNDGFPLEGSEIKTCFQPDKNYFINTEIDSTPDCNDTDPTINPLTDWYKDLDEDGYASITTKGCNSPGSGYTRNILPLGDCDDTDPNINPSVTLECSDNKDNDCDGQVDEIEDLVVYLADKDNDGYGDTNDIVSCNPPTGYIAVYASNSNNKYDCNDNNPLISPGKIEIPYNGVDDDCDPATADNSESFSIPDPIFEQALIDLGIDTDGIQNNLVLVSDLETVTKLDLSFPETNPNLPNVNRKINDLSGIQLFSNLIELDIAGNNISDLRNLTGSNESNKSSNSKIQSLTIITTLKVLNCSYNNLRSLDLSNMNSLNSLNCSNNQLISLNAKNGTNSMFALFNAKVNPNLNCINVDNAQYATNNWTNIDTQTNFSEDCSSILTINTQDSITEKIDIYPNPVSKTLNIVTESSINIQKVILYNTLGQLITPQVINNKIKVIGLQSGLYLLKIKTNQGSATKRFVVK